MGYEMFRLLSSKELNQGKFGSKKQNGCLKQSNSAAVAEEARLRRSQGKKKVFRKLKVKKSL